MKWIRIEQMVEMCTESKKGIDQSFGCEGMRTGTLQE
jgi:hypothetical protein